VEPSLGQRHELMPPRIPKLRKAVAQQDERTLAGFGDVHRDAVRLQGAVRYLGHHPSPMLNCRRDDAAARPPAHACGSPTSNLAGGATRRCVPRQISAAIEPTFANSGRFRAVSGEDHASDRLEQGKWPSPPAKGDRSWRSAAPQR
jgi:hypothetical protein